MKKFIGGIIITSLCLCSLAAAQGLYFTLPRVDGLSDQTHVEAGANASFEIRYHRSDNFSNAERTTGAMLYFNYDVAQLEEVDFTLNPALASSVRIEKEVDLDGVYQLDIMAISPDPDRGFAFDDDLLLGTVTFHVRQDADADALALSWNDDADLVNISLFPENADGQNLDTMRTAPDGVNIVAASVPNCTGVGAAQNPNPATGNTLTITWPIDNDNANDLTANAATYYDGGPGGSGLRYRVYRDGAEVHLTGVGASSWTNADLNDNQEYTFAVQALDACAPNANESANDQTIAATPHDYTPPGASINMTGQLDQQLNLSWGTNDSADLGGYIVVRKASEIGAEVAEPADMTNAAGNNNGTTPDQAKEILEADGWTVVSEGNDASLEDKELDNTKEYHYFVYAYDKIGGAPTNQGYNYSKAGTKGVPGAAPNAISFFRVLSDVSGGVTFMWKTSDPPNYAGAKIVYTTDFEEWGNIDETATEAVDKLLEGDEAKVEEVKWQCPEADKVYYFKAYAHNSSGRLFSDPVYGAAVAGGTGAGSGVVLQTSEQSLKKAEDGFGIKYIVIPFTPVYINNVEITSVGGLINAINLAAGKHVVTALGFWDRNTQKLEGATFNDEGGETYISSGFSLGSHLLTRGDAFQVSVTQDVDFTMTNYTED